MNNKCYLFITINVLTISIMWYKIACLNKKVLYNSMLICELIQKLEDVNNLNIACDNLGRSLNGLNTVLV
jgi:hypothetical protein